MHKKGLYEKYFKRPFDFILAFIALLALSPVLIFISFLVRIRLGSPVIFRQPRPGLNDKIFTLLKFRTMTNKKDSEGDLLPDSERLSKFGKFLRSTSIDELPGLINVLIGDMSIIGPRPLLVEYLDLYDNEQKRRHEVKPGLSGLAQINGRNNLTWEEKFNYDLEYIQNISFASDIKIILLTVLKVLKRSDINPNTSVTMDKFKGKNS